MKLLDHTTPKKWTIADTLAVIMIVSILGTVFYWLVSGLSNGTIIIIP